MATRLKDEYLTISEAAEELGVAESTVRRWIREERLHAYRLGDRRILVKRDDLDSLVTPVRPRKLEIVDITDRAVLERQRNRRMTPEEQERAYQVIERLRERERALRRSRPGYQWTPVDDIIREAKEQRDRRPDWE